MVQPVIVCPLDYERRLIRKAVGLHASIVVSGPGPDAVRAAVHALAADPPPLLILCGVAGGLAETPPAPRIGRIIDRDARAWTVPVSLPGQDPPVTLLGLDEPIATPDKKRSAARAFTAALADCESHAFAESCEDLGLRWCVIRGVSDGPGESLPAGVTQWVDARGKARLGRFLAHVILEPSALPAALRLRRRSRRAMKAAASRLVELLVREKREAADRAIVANGRGESTGGARTGRVSVAPGLGIAQGAIGARAGDTGPREPGAGSRDRSAQMGAGARAKPDRSAPGAPAVHQEPGSA